MRCRFVLIVLVLLLGIVVCGPLFETVDHWDHFPQHQDDLVLTLTVVVAFFGAWFLLTPVAVAVLSRLSDRLIQPARLIARARPSLITPADLSPPPSSLALRI